MYPSSYNKITNIGSVQQEVNITLNYIFIITENNKKTVFNKGPTKCQIQYFETILFLVHFTIKPLYQVKSIMKIGM